VIGEALDAAQQPTDSGDHAWCRHQYPHESNEVVEPSGQIHRREKRPGTTNLPRQRLPLAFASRSALIEDVERTLSRKLKTEQLPVAQPSTRDAKPAGCEPGALADGGAGRESGIVLRVSSSPLSSAGQSVAPTLTDGVVRLNGFTLEDVEAHLAGEDEELARRFGWWPKSPTVETVSSAIRRWNGAWGKSGTTRSFAVRDASTGKLVGHCELRLKEHSIAHVSYSTARTSRSRGYASRALRLASEGAFRHAGAALAQRRELIPVVLRVPGHALRRGFTNDLPETNAHDVQNFEHLSG
jgi:RimJ/RimL family protein N-acetyltransferase